jgi:RNA polymerase sigma-54 factor
MAWQQEAIGLIVDKEQRQLLGQQQHQSLVLLQMNTQELESYLQELATENPLLEITPPVEAPERYFPTLCARQSGPQKEDNYNDALEKLCATNNYEALTGAVLEQIGTLRLSRQEYLELEYLCYELDERGYLPPPDAQAYRAFSQSAARYEAAVARLQALEPAGVGARSLGECLCLQLKRRKIRSMLPYQLCNSYLDRLAKGQLHHIAKTLDIPIEEVCAARDLIAQLNPYPSNGFSGSRNTPYITPDVEVIKCGNSLELTLADRYMSSYGINRYYARMAASKELCAEEQEYFRNKLTQAKWALNCVSRRKEMLLSCAKAIVDMQRDFFLDGESPLIPFTMVELSRQLAVHPSTVSRAVRGKYIACEWGLYPFSSFFAQELPAGSTGRDLSVQMQTLIENENKRKPLSDREIAQQLSNRGISVSRRTVAKYREAAGIPGAPGRKTHEV